MLQRKTEREHIAGILKSRLNKGVQVHKETAYNVAQIVITKEGGTSIMVYDYLRVNGAER